MKEFFKNDLLKGNLFQEFPASPTSHSDFQEFTNADTKDSFFGIIQKTYGVIVPKDGFGMRGRALNVTEGGTAELKIKRINIAERLYRVTGAGIYRDSVLTGHPVPIQRPVLYGQVLGSDSVLTAIYQGKIYWFWGDTNRPGYPLGNFHVPGATSLLPQHGGLDPEVGPMPPTKALKAELIEILERWILGGAPNTAAEAEALSPTPESAPSAYPYPEPEATP